MFVLLNKKQLLVAVILLVAVVSSVLLAVYVPTAITSAQQPCIVIDAGHGGYDHGVSGLDSGVRESDVNLSIATYLARYLQGRGYRVVMTRTKDVALVEATSLKRADMDKRLELIAESNAQLVISLHCNFYPSRYRRGIQVFYGKGDDQVLAATLQDHLNNTLNLPTLDRQFSSLWGDYYLLNHAPCPSVIVECGFLSNSQDEALLCTENYRMLVAYQLFCGLQTYWQLPDNQCNLFV